MMSFKILGVVARVDGVLHVMRLVRCGVAKNQPQEHFA